MKLLNTEEETAKHAANLQPLLHDTLCNHVTIIAGYSGGSDGAFDVMLNEYNGKNRLFWLGHSPEPNTDIAPLFSNAVAQYIGGCDFDTAMIEIARGLGCWPLPILDNPPRHLLNLIGPLPAFPTVHDSETAVLEQTRSRLDQVAQEWDKGRTQEEVESAAFMAGEAAEFGQDVSSFSEAAKTLLAWRFVGRADELEEAAKGLSVEEQDAAFTEVYRNLEEAVRIKPDMHEAFYNWGLALYVQASALSGEARGRAFGEACEKYARAVEIKPDEHEAFNNWGAALATQARGLSGEARGRAFDEAFEKYARAVEIKPDEHEAFNNWGLALYEKASALSGEARGRAFDEAREKLIKAKELTGLHSYNLACLNALTGEIETALDELEGCLADGTVPSKDHLSKDDDMAALRDEPRFKALLNTM